LVPFAALGAILPGHPFDVFYNYGLRHLLGTPALPRYVSTGFCIPSFIVRVFFGKVVCGQSEV
jgi:hypothetical protein